MGKKSHAVFMAEVESLVGDEYTVLERYEGCNKKLDIQHNKCGFIYNVRPTSFLGGSRCPVCAKYNQSQRKLKTSDQFEAEVFDLVGESYDVITPYIKSNMAVIMKHVKCGLQYRVTPCNFLAGNRCPKCSMEKKAEKQTKTTAVFMLELYELYGNEYTVLGDYVAFNQKVLVRHNTCGSEYEATPTLLLRGRTCPMCLIKKRAENRRMTPNSFLDKVESLVGNEYSILGEYTTGNSSILIKHNKCGHEFYASPKKFLEGKRCPACSKK